MKRDIIELCRNSRDYRDICYMVDIIKDTEVRVDVLKQLGYMVVISNYNDGLKSIKMIRNRIMIQITSPIPIINKTRCVIFNKNDFKKWT